jgi:sec-independent protein translocase protein TatA
MEASLLFIQRMGPWGIVLIVLVVLLLFGGKKIPELMKGLGKGVKEFKDATNNPEGNDNPKGEVNEKNN